MPSKSSVAIVLRKSPKFKTYLSRYVGPNVNRTPSKNGKVYDFVMEYLKAAGETAAEREFHVTVSGFYMTAQPSESGTERAIRLVQIDAKTGAVSDVDDGMIRAAFKMAPKATTTAKASYIVSSNAVRL